MLGMTFFSYPILAYTIVKPRKKTVTLMILKDAIMHFDDDMQQKSRENQI